MALLLTELPRPEEAEAVQEREAEACAETGAQACETEVDWGTDDEAAAAAQPAATEEEEKVEPSPVERQSEKKEEEKKEEEEVAVATAVPKKEVPGLSMALDELIPSKEEQEARELMQQPWSHIRGNKGRTHRGSGGAQRRDWAGCRAIAAEAAQWRQQWHGWWA